MPKNELVVEGVVKLELPPKIEAADWFPKEAEPVVVGEPKKEVDERAAAVPKTELP